MDVDRISSGWENSGHPRPQRSPPADIPVIPADDPETDGTEKGSHPRCRPFRLKSGWKRNRPVQSRKCNPQSGKRPAGDKPQNSSQPPPVDISISTTSPVFTPGNGHGLDADPSFRIWMTGPAPSARLRGLQGNLDDIRRDDPGHDTLFTHTVYPHCLQTGERTESFPGLKRMTGPPPPPTRQVCIPPALPRMA